MASAEAAAAAAAGAVGGGATGGVQPAGTTPPGQQQMPGLGEQQVLQPPGLTAAPALAPTKNN